MKRADALRVGIVGTGALGRHHVRIASELLQDFRYGARLLGANRTFSIVAILTLAVAIGGNTAIFSVVNAVVLKPLAVSEPDRLVRIYPGESRISAPNARDLRERSNVFTDVTLQRGTLLTLETGALPVRLVGNVVGRNYFTVLGTQARLGRTLLPTDTRDDLVVLSDGAHRARFASDPSIVGRTIELDGRHARGATVVDWRRESGRPDHVRILLRYDQARFEGLVRAALAAG